MKLTGSGGVVWHGQLARARAQQAATRGLGEIAEVLLEEGNRTIPHQTGHMMRTGATWMPRHDLALVTYDTPYAVRQHEDTRLHHARGRRAEWLRLALDEGRARYLAHLARRVQEALR